MTTLCWLIRVDSKDHALEMMAWCRWWFSAALVFALSERKAFDNDNVSDDVAYTVQHTILELSMCM